MQQVSARKGRRRHRQPVRNRFLSKVGKMPALLLVMVSLVALMLLGDAFQPVNSSPVEIASNWRSASFPVENFQAYTSGFGYRRSPSNPSNWEFHRGLDIAAPVGSYVRAWWGGKIVNLSDGTACGTSIAIQSGQWRHIYCHLQGHVENKGSDRYLVDREGGIILQQGQVVPTAARIGRVGMTGRTTGPHLHWGIKYGSNYVDPGEVLRKMYASS
ncbi:MAG: M23 family metallopeptidase [Oscillatoria sp. PMC 1051.18]|nr:M23 family metallopeptidase [Oscillatoria sp. PMC 1050.18]MEC5031881.1 M23 family metallopeptidase [Oscillatoria sp. PMC 1051.18]